MNTLELQVKRSEIALRLLRYWRELDAESELLLRITEDPSTIPAIRNEVVADRRALLEAKSILTQEAARFNQRASRLLLKV